MNFVYIKTTQCGNSEARQMLTGFLNSMHALFVRKATAFILFGIVRDPHEEFFATPNESGEMVVRTHQIAYFMTESQCKEAIEISSSTATLKKLKSSKLDRIITEQSLLFTQYVDTFNARLFLEDMRDLRSRIAHVLFAAVVVNDAIADQFQAFRSIYLAGQGDFIDSLLSEELRVRKRLDLSLVPMTTVELNRVFQRCYLESIQGQSWEILASKFEFKESESQQLSIFGSKLQLQYDIVWPLSLLVSTQNIVSYNKLFYFFTTLRRANGRLANLNQSLHHSKSRAVPQPIWVLCSRQLFFLNALNSFIQVFSTLI